MRNLYSVMTASDDAHVRIFDLATASTVLKLKAHKVFFKNLEFALSKSNRENHSEILERY
jgi:hypothetical protein